jgi:hypothetical protein
LSAENHDTRAGSDAHFPAPVLATGSGRCGTKALAETIGAVHEPGEWGLKPFSDFAIGTSPLYTGSNLGEYFGLLKRMLWEKKQQLRVVDPRLSLVLPFAQSMIFDAHWIILFRNPVDTCRSWLERRTWENNEHHRIRPIEGWLDSDEDVYKAAWTWNTMYRLCLANMTDKFEFWYADDDLDRVENKGPGTYKMESWERQVISDLCHDTENQLDSCRDDAPRPVYDWYMGGRDDTD